jgi:hypothetical protein
MASPSYNDMETFGEDYTKKHYISKIKYILKNYHSDDRAMRYYIDIIEEEYNEILSNGAVRYESWQKQDMFNELIKKAKEEIQEENLPYRNNPPYNPFDSDDFRGGKNKRSRKNKSRKNKSRKNKRTKKYNTSKNKRNKHTKKKTYKKQY